MVVGYLYSRLLSLYSRPFSLVSGENRAAAATAEPHPMTEEKGNGGGVTYPSRIRDGHSQV